MTKIDITITVGKDSKIMSLDEAKELYIELNKLFGKNDPYNVPHSKSYIYDDSYIQDSHTGSVGHGKTSTTVDIDSTPKPNPKVEAARNRAAQRTSGCGKN